MKTFVPFFYLLASVWMLGSCQEDIIDKTEESSDKITILELEGVWVEEEERTDTIAFSDLPDTDWFWLLRGKENSNGNLLPKSGSGNWNYKPLLGKDSVSLNWALSSNSRYHNYFFRVEKGKMKIGNFYRSNDPVEIITFVKLE
ncbi:hypothetical protein D770_12550 [Flammeovirgaceae bacterium 311]|nr:hypothetical protein D770_12550 [Flammeovirgaceae bacterium 311]